MGISEIKLYIARCENNMIPKVNRYCFNLYQILWSEGTKTLQNAHIVINMIPKLNRYCFNLYQILYGVRVLPHIVMPKTKSGRISPMS